ncbi:hypothetical protein BDN71DRAFT_1511372 [Pleurotus eryngii]|uniref:Uncharacterized protein n=1 Tax=Pleurotus eryngii TaxID=5323 RepID=A0A9P6DB34_PLEER|nr:hypothetical protein BDN71DRAFT_1511372 [Pleurotus eryngii]
MPRTQREVLFFGFEVIAVEPAIEFDRKPSMSNHGAIEESRLACGSLGGRTVQKKYPSFKWARFPRGRQGANPLEKGRRTDLRRTFEPDMKFHILLYCALGWKAMALFGAILISGVVIQGDSSKEKQKHYERLE